jgi:hypothetical protein
MARSPFPRRFRPGVHRVVTVPGATLDGMADFLVIAGLVVFVAAMLGLIWGVEHMPSGIGDRISAAFRQMPAAVRIRSVLVIGIAGRGEGR